MKTEKRTKTAAIKHARSNVGELYRFGDGWKYSTYDSSVDAWRESHACDYWQSMASRCGALVQYAVEWLHDDAEAGYEARHDYESNGQGISWTDFVD